MILVQNSPAAAGIQPPVGTGNVVGRGAWITGHVATFADGTGKVLRDGGAVIVSITTFGGVGDNTTENTTPLINALASLSGTGGTISFPPGKFRFNSAPVFNFPPGI